MSRRIILSTLTAVTVLLTPTAASGASPSARDRLEDLRERLEAVEESLAETQATAELFERQRDVAEDQVDLARAAARDWRYTAYALFGAMVLAGAVSLIRRRNTIRIQIPDTPEEFLEASEPPGRSGDR